MPKKKVTTKGTLEEMREFTDVDEKTIQEAIEKIEHTANIEVDIPEKER